MQKMINFKYIFINSVLAFISAFLLTTIVHESGHFFSYLLFDAHPVLYHNFVQIPDQHLNMHVKIISALAGPIISLIQGIVLVLIISKKPRNTSKSLLLLWMSLLGFVNFFGYLMLTPLTTKGDTGKVAELLNIPYFYRILIAVLGVIVLIYLVIKMGKYFSNYIPGQTELKIKGKYVNALLMFPIIIGSLINVLLAFPIPVFLSVIYPATSAYVIMSSYGVILKSECSFTSNSEIIEKISVFLLTTTIISVLLNRLLTIGIGY